MDGEAINALTLSGLGLSVIGMGGYWLKRTLMNQLDKKTEDLMMDKRSAGLVDTAQDIIKDQREEVKALRTQLQASQDRTIEMALTFHMTFEKETSRIRAENKADIDKMRLEHQEVTRGIYARFDQEANGHAECKARLGVLEQRDNIRSAVAGQPHQQLVAVPMSSVGPGQS